MASVSSTPHFLIVCHPSYELPTYHLSDLDAILDDFNTKALSDFLILNGAGYDCVELHETAVILSFLQTGHVSTLVLFGIGAEGASVEPLFTPAIQHTIVSWVQEGGVLIVNGEGNGDLSAMALFRTWFQKDWHMGGRHLFRTVHSLQRTCEGYTDPEFLDAVMYERVRIKAHMITRIPTHEILFKMAEDAVDEGNSHSEKSDESEGDEMEELSNAWGDEFAAVALADHGEGRIAFIGDNYMQEGTPQTILAIGTYLHREWRRRRSFVRFLYKAGLQELPVVNNRGPNLPVTVPRNMNKVLCTPELVRQIVGFM